jgi:linoleoyl-CoA desaturase
MKKHRVHFRKEDPSGFYGTLRKRVSDELSRKAAKVDYSPGLRMVFLITLYSFSIFVFCTSAEPVAIMISAVAMGFLTTIIFLNVVHDASHKTLFRNATLNSIAAHTLEIFGADTHIWTQRHLQSHHSYPNIQGLDPDIKQSDLIRVVPNAPFLAHHTYQPYYIPFVYLLYTINWFFHRDIVDAFRNDQALKVSDPRKVKIVLQKIAWLFCFIVMPGLLTGQSIWIYISGFILMHFAASFSGVVALTTSHVSHDSEFPEPDENGMMADSWAMHQLRVTQDFATDNLFITTCLGYFNYHVAHHLFPSVPHRHYRRITAIIQSTASEYGLTYKYKSLVGALLSHYSLLVNNSRRPIEIDM